LNNYFNVFKNSYVLLNKGSSLKLNDEITISVKNISANSKPEEIKKIDPKQTILEGNSKHIKI
jgi:hypothetical protein